MFHNHFCFVSASEETTDPEFLLVVLIIGGAAGGAFVLFFVTIIIIAVAIIIVCFKRAVSSSREVPPQPQPMPKIDRPPPIPPRIGSRDTSISIQLKTTPVYENPK